MSNSFQISSGNFVSDSPELLKEWDSIENSVSPQTVSVGSKRSFWWKCSQGHSWYAKVYRKTKCPYCSGRFLCPENCLATTHPELEKEWCSVLNGAKIAYDFTAKSSEKIWWKCSKNLEHVWEAKIRARVKGSGCLYCAGKLVSTKESLATVYPSIAAEWHPTKNGILTPDQVRFGSGKPAWWKCSKNAEHVWECKITNRGTHQSGCPYCSNKKTGADNCLAITHPDLAKEWHPTKNKSLTPYNIVAGSDKKIWWLCKNGHEWESPSSRRARGIGCSRCSGRKASQENCLTLLYPDIAEEFHPTKNGSLSPDQFVPGSGQKVWWQCLKNKTHEWEARIQDRVGGYGRNGTNCPHCKAQASDAEYRIAAELKLIFPNLEQKKIIKGKEADIFIKELNLVIEVDGGYFHKSDRRIKNDKEKNKFFENLGYYVQRLRGKGLIPLSEHDIEFDCGNIKLADIKNILNKIRVRLSRDFCLGSATEQNIGNYLKRKTYGNQEEYLKIRKALPGKFTLGNLKEKRPDLAKEWHPINNNQLLPEYYSVKSGKQVSWQCSKNKEHVWEAKISCRANGRGCPYCSNKKVCRDNCLATVNPKLAEEWHPSRNMPLTPKDVVANSNRKIWWRCLINPEHEWKTSADVRHRENTGCPFCSGNKAHSSNCLATANPKLAAEWHPIKNESLNPQQVTTGSNKVVWWQCGKDKTHEWEASIYSRNRGNGCPCCSGRKVHLSSCLATVNPELAAEWHPSENGELKPYDFTIGSKKKIWWVCPLRHEYEASILTRSHGHGCPECAYAVIREKALKRWKKRRKMKADENIDLSL